MALAKSLITVIALAAVAAKASGFATAGLAAVDIAFAGPVTPDGRSIHISGSSLPAIRAAILKLNPNYESDFAVPKLAKKGQNPDASNASPGCHDEWVTLDPYIDTTTISCDGPLVPASQWTMHQHMWYMQFVFGNITVAPRSCVDIWYECDIMTGRRFVGHSTTQLCNLNSEEEHTITLPNCQYGFCPGGYGSHNLRRDLEKIETECLEDAEKESPNGRSLAGEAVHGRSAYEIQHPSSQRLKLIKLQSSESTMLPFHILPLALFFAPLLGVSFRFGIPSFSSLLHLRQSRIRDLSNITEGIIPNAGNAAPGLKDESTDLYAVNRTRHCAEAPIPPAPHKSLNDHANAIQEITWNITVAANSCVNLYSHCGGASNKEESTALLCNMNTDPQHTVTLRQPDHPITYKDFLHDDEGPGIFHIVRDLGKIQQECPRPKSEAGERVSKGEIVHGPGDGSWATRWGHVGARKCGGH
ncbi:hypothetical protein MKZ38_005548 [Zalerion maritima]|uniref:Uncharacterized protein n=1 Tax=Zalerion maritima TaxID=339359 RepID=A0AAD5WQB3_9PEZI|nr:hypothetical protein MKZ38_005548 [Zalerion maritima]